MNPSPATHRVRWLSRAFAAVVALVSGPWVRSADPVTASYTIPYQTTLRTQVSGATTIYRGDAFFKFVLYRQANAGAARVPVWSHDPDYLINLAPNRPVEVPEPSRMVKVSVPDGVASVYLGGTDAVLLEPNGNPSAALMSPLDAGAFATGTIRLRVWMGKTTNSFELLSPDLPLAASAFALRASVAETVAAKGITSAALSDDLNNLLARVGTVADRSDDPTLLGLGFTPVRQFPAAPYTRVGQTGAPNGRVNHSAVWTGTDLYIFGGRIALNGALTAGPFAYRPANDSWTQLPTSGAPTARENAASVWTGSRWLVWGGVGLNGFLADGAAFDPALNDWSPMAAPPVTFIGRRYLSSAWTGTHWLLWGGLTIDGPAKDGAAYNPTNNTWVSLPAFPGVARYLQSTVWTGSKMVVWGGQTLSDGPLADGYIFDPGANPATGTWTAVAAAPIAKRHSAGAFWTPGGMVVWGGIGANDSVLADGAIWSTSGGAGGSWRSLPAATGYLSAAALVRGATTPVGLYLFGGMTDSGASGAGAYLDWNSLAWYATPSPAPNARLGHTVVSLSPGTDILIFGGADPAVFGAFNDVWRLPAERTQYLYRKP